MHMFGEIVNNLSQDLDIERFEHTLGVAYTAANLAMKYDVDIDKAFLAGLLHDVAKRCKSDKYIEMCHIYDIDISEAERNNPGLLHAKLGAYIAASEYEIDDPEILSSIECHTTGKPNMSMLEKIIYIADYIEPGRDKQPHLDIIRKKVYEDINSALFIILEDTVEYLTHSKKTIDPMTYETYLYYKGMK